MPKELYEVVLTSEEIAKLMDITHKGSNHSARLIMHANILLKTNDGDLTRKKTDREIADMFNISKTTVNQVRKTYANEGLESALNRRTRLTAPILSKITGDLACLKKQVFKFTSPENLQKGTPCPWHRHEKIWDIA